MIFNGRETSVGATCHPPLHRNDYSFDNVNIYRFWRFYMRFLIWIELFLRFCDFGLFFSTVLRFLIEPTPPPIDTRHDPTAPSFCHYLL